MIIKSIIPLIMLLHLPLSQALTLNGFTAFDSVIELNARVSGVVDTIAVKPGQLVQKGDLLIQLDTVPYRARLDRAMAIEKSLQPVVLTAQMELERAEELYDRDSLSQVALKNAENALAKAEGNYQAASADRIFDEYQLANTALRAPVDARVLQIHSNIAQFLDPAVNLDPSITLVKNRQMRAIAVINSEQWSYSLINKKATVLYREQKFTGKVSYVGFKRSSQANGLPAYEVHVNFETDQLIPAEMPVTIEIKD